MDTARRYPAMSSRDISRGGTAAILVRVQPAVLVQVAEGETIFGEGKGFWTQIV
jgi:hypothetical protein